MQAFFQKLFTVPGTDAPISFVGRQADGAWIEGVLKRPDGSIQADVSNAAVFFVEALKDKDQWGTDSEIEGYLGRPRAGLIHDNYRTWRLQERHLSQSGKWVDSICPKLDGLILEIAVGPGGGIFPYLLRLDPSKRLLVNDIGRWIVEDWKKLNDLEKLGASVGFAQFDLRSCPLRSGSVDFVISNQGISNTSDVQAVLKELHRILAPGGTMFLEETSFSSETVSRLSAGATREARLKWPNSDFEWTRQAIAASGLILEDVDLFGHGESWPVQGTWGDFGQQNGVVPLTTDLYHVTLKKPGC